LSVSDDVGVMPLHTCRIISTTTICVRRGQGPLNNASCHFVRKLRLSNFCQQWNSKEPLFESVAAPFSDGG
jgi:hypothetical protein